MTCGAGVVFRPTGALLIDNWITYDVNKPTREATVQNPVLRQNDFQPINNPSSVLLGQTLPDTLKICVESNGETKCTTLKDIRAQISKTK